MNTRIHIAGLTLGLSLAAASVFAFNLSFLDDAAIARFNEQDIDMMIETLEQTLEHGKDGVVVEWENPKTRNHGSVTPLNSKIHEGFHCRDADIKNFAGTFTGRTIRLMCKTDDGSWRVVPTS